MIRYERPVIPGVPCSQETARQIIDDLDSNNPERREKGRLDLQELERQAAGCGHAVDVCEMQRVAKSNWSPETMNSASIIAMFFWAFLGMVVLVGFAWGVVASVMLLAAGLFVSLALSIVSTSKTYVNINAKYEE
jgi:hypothetical protein